MINSKYFEFNELLKLPNSLEKNEKIINLIEEKLHHSFLDDERYWFNKLCNNGLLEVIVYCQKNIKNFSLYDNRYNVKNLSNVSFIWSIESGNIDLINFFLNHKEFKCFNNQYTINHIGSMLQYYKDRSKSFDLQNYENVMFLLAENFSSAVQNILDCSLRQNKNDEISSILEKFVIKYKKDLTPHFLKENNDLLTIYCMALLNNHSHKLALFIRKEFASYSLEPERVSVLLNWSDRDINKINWLMSHPQFIHLNKQHFHCLFKYIFQDTFARKPKKLDYEYFHYVVKLGLYEFTKENFNYSIKNNVFPLVKKYHKKFNLYDYQHYFEENKCTLFIEKTIKEKEYKTLDKKLSDHTKNIRTNRPKV